MLCWKPWTHMEGVARMESEDSAYYVVVVPYGRIHRMQMRHFGTIVEDRLLAVESLAEAKRRAEWIATASVRGELFTLSQFRAQRPWNEESPPPRQVEGSPLFDR